MGVELTCPSTWMSTDVYSHGQRRQSVQQIHLDAETLMDDLLRVGVASVEPTLVSRRPHVIHDNGPVSEACRFHVSHQLLVEVEPTVSPVHGPEPGIEVPGLRAEILIKKIHGRELRLSHVSAALP